jgi:hypothetical protein
MKNDIRREENAFNAIIQHGIEINFITKNCQQMALKSIKRLILSIDGASSIFNFQFFCCMVSEPYK